MQAVRRQTEDGFGALSDLMDVLHQKKFERLVVEPLSFDLSVAFAGGYMSRHSSLMQQLGVLAHPR